jgi:RpiB/LacA/LacB family sugar-phosphate isomerase
VRIVIASDQAGREIKQRLTVKLAAAGYGIVDATPSIAAKERPDYSEQVALGVLRHDAERGIIITSRAVGASVAANRVPGIRAALCHDAYSARLGAHAEGMNVLVLSLHALEEERAYEIVEAYLGANLAAVETVGGLPPWRLQRVFAYVSENLAKEVSVAELAQAVGMSQYYFSKLFKLSTGTTPHQYVMRQRVERAQSLLRDGSHALANVAREVGFETQSHFTSVFRHLVGITPKRYREMHQPMPQVGLEMDRHQTAA